VNSTLHLVFIIYFFSFFIENIIILYTIIKERKTVLNLLESKIKYTNVIILLYMILEAFKVKIASLLIKAWVIFLVYIHGVNSH
jgi:hypothetical protein